MTSKGAEKMQKIPSASMSRKTSGRVSSKRRREPTFADDKSGHKAFVKWLKEAPAERVIFAYPREYPTTDGRPGAIWTQHEEFAREFEPTVQSISTWVKQVERMPASALMGRQALSGRNWAPSM
jgi:hypothetical protein